jgi:hypothetical protein
VIDFIGQEAIASPFLSRPRGGLRDRPESEALQKEKNRGLTKDASWACNVPDSARRVFSIFAKTFDFYN